MYLFIQAVSILNILTCIVKKNNLEVILRPFNTELLKLCSFGAFLYLLLDIFFYLFFYFYNFAYIL